MANTPWGKAEVVEEVTVQQKGSGEREFAAVIQYLEDERGGGMVRFSYSTDASVRRGPLTVRLSDLSKLKKALARKPRLHRALQWTE
ncbi:hypothetical protein AKJ09_00544 [Labilithrix luteola]|uniref:Uncharacterized protein n=1 Tax=Labilithrix luteola TaxID=1391654 RepID=A0A0K1PK26_9BACT|nr:hypothetical protein [Labilithrix luteola]AKU93880.1 hypothetical protein AKJ09_00544 [Labilithrix luteola]